MAHLANRFDQLPHSSPFTRPGAARGRQAITWAATSASDARDPLWLARRSHPMALRSSCAALFGALTLRFQRRGRPATFRCRSGMTGSARRRASSADAAVRSTYKLRRRSTASRAALPDAEPRGDADAMRSASRHAASTCLTSPCTANPSEPWAGLFGAPLWRRNALVEVCAH